MATHGGLFGRLRKTAWVAVLALCAPQGAAAEARPANPRASRAAGEVLSLLRRLPSLPAGRVLSGQFIGYGGAANLKEIKLLHEQTGRWASILSPDYHDYNLHRPNYRANPLLGSHWSRGGLVMIHNHANNPATGGKAKDRSIKFAQLLNPDSATGKNWNKELDAVIEGLSRLRSKGIVVLWRPFHEMNGDWFWWGNQNPVTFAAVWRAMFERFAAAGLDNVLWVYSADAGRPGVTAHYTGSDFVDVVALDAYTTDLRSVSDQAYRDMLSLGKPFGFSEIGPAGKAPSIQRADGRNTLAALKEKFPKAAFFVSWNGPWSLTVQSHSDRLLKDPWILNRRDSPLNIPLPEDPIPPQPRRK